MKPTLAQLTHGLKAVAGRLGFELSGACPAVEPPGLDRLRDWLAAGYAGQMSYLPDRESAYSHPRHVLEGARSILMLGMNYRTAEAAAGRSQHGRISRYAWGSADYHDLIHTRLKELRRWLNGVVPEARVRGVVDTAPLLEREFAVLAGLGWVGKNTLLINYPAGSWFFLAALLTDQPLAYDQPTDVNHCGSCTACLDACPTGAFPEPYVLDATRCISYHTIERRDAIPTEFREQMGDWLFGCDVCQEVCPWNGRAPVSVAAAFQPQPDANPVELASLFDLSDDDFRDRFRKTPLWRSRRRGILRNAAIGLGNRPGVASTVALTRGLNDAEPLIRGASAWSLGRINSSPAREALATRREVEANDEVCEEIDQALAMCGNG